MHQTVLAGQNIHKGTEIHEFGDASFIVLADFIICSDLLNTFAGGLTCHFINGGDFYCTVILNIDGCAGFLSDCPDSCTTLADHIPDLVRMDLDGSNTWCKL